MNFIVVWALIISSSSGNIITGHGNNVNMTNMFYFYDFNSCKTVSQSEPFKNFNKQCMEVKIPATIILK